MPDEMRVHDALCSRPSYVRGLSASFQDMQDTLAALGTFGKSCARHSTQDIVLWRPPFGPTVDRYVSVNSRVRYA